MLAELQTVPLLIQLGITNIIYKKENSADFIAILNDISIEIEVSRMRGPNFKTQINIPSTNNSIIAAELTTRQLISKLKTKFNEEKKQISDPSNAIIVLFIDLEEAHSFWLKNRPYNGKHPLQAFVDSCEIHTILFAPGFTLYVSEKLAANLIAYDRNQYLQLAYGISKKDIENNINKCIKAIEAMMRGKVQYDPISDSLTIEGVNSSMDAEVILTVLSKHNLIYIGIDKKQNTNHE